MGSYDLLRKYINSLPVFPDRKINVEDEVISSPKTPDMSEIEVLKMRVFDGKILRDCIISNIRSQLQIYKGDLNLSTWISLLEFLDQDFGVSDTKKIYIQVLVHFSKFSVSEDSLKSYGFSDMGSIDYYENILKDFIARASDPLTDDITIKAMEEVADLKKRLLSHPILLAIEKNISAIETSTVIQCVNVDDISKLISSASIYEVKHFGSFAALRGACLLDGVLICTSNVAGPRGSARYSADLLTLASHEFSHHIIRLLFADFNFPSPWKYTVSDAPRFDFHPTNSRYLEFGRNTELILFDNIQPNWFNSLWNAAVTFLQRIDANHSLPVIQKNEHGRLGLSARSPSSFYGIDVKPEVMSFM